MSKFERGRAAIFAGWMITGVVLMPIIYYVPGWLNQIGIFSGSFWGMDIPKMFALSFLKFVGLFSVNTWGAAFEMGVLIAIAHTFFMAYLAKPIRSIFRTIRKGRESKTKVV